MIAMIMMIEHSEGTRLEYRAMMMMPKKDTDIDDKRTKVEN